ncbi:hypothetical protein [Micromonospora haikouensis]|uniref:hypothetical protein n=1 Tax=Micromonospora haikouensis TaxID=686309 RepID=UPI003D742693
MHARAYQQARRRAIAYDRWVPGLIDAGATAELIREMVAAGWGFSALAGQLNRRVMTLHTIAHGRRRRVSGHLAGQVSDLYDELLCYPPPAGHAATYARTTAARHGWHPPVDEPWRRDTDVDPVVAERAAHGHHPGREMGAAERRAAAVYAVHTRRLSNGAAAEALGLSTRTVTRHLAHHRAVPSGEE